MGPEAQGTELTARAAALTPLRAHGTPLLEARLRTQPEDFLVEEELAFAPSGAGQHVLLRVRKRDANTAWVARQLARSAGCAPGAVGYAGLKDRHSLSSQWFSVPQPAQSREWLAVRGEGFEVLEAHAHTRKLPRGALAGNRFAIRVAAPPHSGAELAQRLAARLELISRRGVPNYFGPQRFGHDAGNLAPPLGRPSHFERGLMLSAARSALFNALLSARVAQGSWDELLEGDLANLDGRGSFFPVQVPDALLRERSAHLEVHPTGALWGRGQPQSSAGVLELECAIAAALHRESELCAHAGLRQERRSLRLRVQELRCETEEASVRLHFFLRGGSFATAVLRELVASAPAEQSALSPQRASSSTYTAPVPPSTGRAET